MLVITFFSFFRGILNVSCHQTFFRWPFFVYVKNHNYKCLGTSEEKAHFHDIFDWGLIIRKLVPRIFLRFFIDLLSFNCFVIVTFFLSLLMFCLFDTKKWKIVRSVTPRNTSEIFIVVWNWFFENVINKFLNL